MSDSNGSNRPVSHVTHRKAKQPKKTQPHRMQHKNTQHKKTPRKYMVRRVVAICSIIALVCAVGISVAASSPQSFTATHQDEINEYQRKLGTRKSKFQQIHESEKERDKNAVAKSESEESDNAGNKEEANLTPEEKDKREIAALEAPIDQAQHDEILAKARQSSEENGKTAVQMTYCVASKGNVNHANLEGFENTIFRALNNPKGWPRAGVVFTQGQPGTCQMTLTLASPDVITTFSQGCSEEYSCRVGNDVIINEKRWNNSVEHWLATGGVLSQYRTMVINHEVGHRLGHVDNETTCEGPGKAAPLMQEQSMDLRGCTPNAFPLENELWTTYTGPGT